MNRNVAWRTSVLFVAAFLSLSSTVSIPTSGQASNAGPITFDPANPRWLYRGNGAPLFMCGPGDPEGFLYRGTLDPDGRRTGDQDALIDKLVGTGANCIWVTAVRSHGGDGTSTENPFVDHDEDLGLNSLVLDQWENWFERLDTAGVVIFFTFYDDSANVWNTGSTVGADEREFFQSIVDRFESLDNLIWSVAEEYQEAYTSGRVSALAAAIDEDDDFNHPITVHQLNGYEFDFPNDANLHSFAMQNNNDLSYPGIHERVVDAWIYADGRYNVNSAEVVFHYTDREESRKRCWAGVLGGGYMMVQNMTIADTPIEALEDCGRIVAFMESTNFHQMSPRDDLAREGTEYVFGDPAVGYIAYASNLSGNIGISIPMGFYDLSWLDCESGATATEGFEALLGGDNSLPKPGSIGSEVAVSIVPSMLADLDLDPALMGRPSGISVFGNPNPFRTSVTIRYVLPQASTTRLAIYDLGGGLVREFVNTGTQRAGPHEWSWDGLDSRGHIAPAGCYVCRIDAGGDQAFQRLVRVK